MNKIQYLSIICLSSIAVLFCSCSKDDNPENKKEETNVQYTENDAKIVGTWTVEGNLSNNVTYTFYKEGSGVWSQIGENNILRFFQFYWKTSKNGKVAMRIPAMWDTLHHDYNVSDGKLTLGTTVLSSADVLDLHGKWKAAYTESKSSLDEGDKELDSLEIVDYKNVSGDTKMKFIVNPTVSHLSQYAKAEYLLTVYSFPNFILQLSDGTDTFTRAYRYRLNTKTSKLCLEISEPTSTQADDFKHYVGYVRE